MAQTEDPQKKKKKKLDLWLEGQRTLIIGLGFEEHQGARVSTLGPRRWSWQPEENLEEEWGSRYWTWNKELQVEAAEVENLLH